MTVTSYQAALVGLLSGVVSLYPAVDRTGRAQQFFAANVPARFRPAAQDEPALERFVALARWLSAGGLPGQQQGEADVPDARVRLIYDQVCLDGVGQDRAHYLRARPLALAGLLDLLDESPREPRAGEAYSELLKIVEEAARCDTDDVPTYLENLLQALQRAAWCVPCGYPDLPEVSMYDHARISAALAACLAAGPASAVQDGPGSPIPPEAPLALLVSGGISGIQDFIYTISSKKAASALRGRSLYVQLLTEAAARYTLRRLDLPITNLLMLGGGRFFLLARPGAEEEARLAEIQMEISRLLLAFHGIDLYLPLVWEPLTHGSLYGQGLANCWQKLDEKRGRAKLRRFSELGGDLYSVFSPLVDQGNEKKECTVCGREHPGTEDGKCPQCLGFQALGEDLREAEYLQLCEVDFSAWKAGSPPGSYQQILACLGMEATFTKTPPVAPGWAKRSLRLALNDEALRALAPREKSAVGRRFLVTVTPTIASTKERERLAQAGMEDVPPAGSVKPFDALALSATGFQGLAVLRMDVDNMGRILTGGFGDTANLPRIASLGAMTNLFFEGWCGELARRYNRPGGMDTDRVYSIYSGGDDLFFVGAWDALPNLAADIRRDFRRFTGDHPLLHASAGITLAGGRYPLYQAAEDARVALEDHAKNHPGKNAVHFLGETVSWERFSGQDGVQSVQSLALLLEKLVGEGRAPKQLLQRIAQLYALYMRAEERRKDEGSGATRGGEEQVLWGPWQWRAAYFLRRLEFHSSAQNEIEAIYCQLKEDNFRSIRWMGAAARWADLLTR